MARYLPHSVDVTAVDIQKLMYFMQQAGEPLRLDYQKGRYGPYADNLRRLLASMEGHYISGMGDGSSRALDKLPFHLLEGAEEAADEVLGQRSDTKARFDRVAQLIEGFESTYGLELLATTHWVAVNGADRGPSMLDSEAIAREVRTWSPRKGKLFTTRHVSTALEHLRSLGWLDEPPTAGEPAMV